MPAPIISLVISAVSKVGAGLENALNSVAKFGKNVIDEISSIGGKLTKIFGVLSGLVIGFGTTVTKVITTFVGAYMDGEKATIRLNEALANSGKVWIDQKKYVDDVIQSLQTLTSFSDNDIKKVVTALIRTEKLDPSKLGEFTERVLDTALAMEDLGTSIKLWERYLIDPIDALTLVDKSLWRLTSAEEENRDVIKKWGKDSDAQAFIMSKVSREFGRARREALSISGAWKQFQSRVDTLKESIGGALAKMLNLPERIQKITAKLKELEIDPDKKLQKWFATNFAFVSKFLDTLDSFFRMLETPTSENKVLFEIDKQAFLLSLRKALNEFGRIFEEIVDAFGWLWIEIGAKIGEGIIKGIFNAFKNMGLQLLDKLNSPAEIRDEFLRGKGETAPEKKRRHEAENKATAQGEIYGSDVFPRWSDFLDSIDAMKGRNKPEDAERAKGRIQVYNKMQEFRDEKDMEKWRKATDEWLSAGDKASMESAKASEMEKRAKMQKNEFDKKGQNLQTEMIKSLMESQLSDEDKAKWKSQVEKGEYKTKEKTVINIEDFLRGKNPFSTKWEMDFTKTLNSKSKINTGLGDQLNSIETEGSVDTDRIVYALAEVKNSVDNLTAV